MISVYPFHNLKSVFKSLKIGFEDGDAHFFKVTRRYIYAHLINSFMKRSWKCIPRSEVTAFPTNKFIRIPKGQRKWMNICAGRMTQHFWANQYLNLREKENMLKESNIRIYGMQRNCYHGNNFLLVVILIQQTKGNTMTGHIYTSHSTSLQECTSPQYYT